MKLTLVKIFSAFQKAEKILNEKLKIFNEITHKIIFFIQILLKIVISSYIQTDD
jgi:hypothetical protein